MDWRHGKAMSRLRPADLFPALVSAILARAPGLAVTLVLAIIAIWLSSIVDLSPMITALAAGYLISFSPHTAKLEAGVLYAASFVLRLGVALLGARISIEQIASLGFETLIGVPIVLAMTIAMTIGFSRVLGKSGAFGVLAGGATAICGASAALAISATLPGTKNRENETVFVVVGVTTLSTIAMILYPAVAVQFELDPVQSGVFIGASIHDVAQVVGAGYAISVAAGDTAVATKLYRVALLIPIVMVLAMVFRSHGGNQVRVAAILPWFLVAFAVLVICNSTGVISDEVADGLALFSKVCLVSAIAALGFRTSFSAIASLGRRSLIILIASTVVIFGAAFTLSNLIQ